jgi:hypothetical protein
MRRVQVLIELDEEDYAAFEAEAKRSDSSVEALLERVLRGLYRDLRQEEREADHPILFP